MTLALQRPALVLVIAMGAGQVASAQQYSVYDYWLMPYGRALSRWTVRWPADGTCTGEQAPTLDARNYTWWRGALWGRSVYLQTFPETLRYDVYVDSNNQLEYWASFRGNAWDIDHPTRVQPGDSHAFSTPFIQFRRRMSVGDVLQQPITVSWMGAGGRYAKVTNPNIQFRLRIASHLDTFTDPNSGLTWEDVLVLELWTDYRPTDPNYGKETYWQARGFGTVRFETTNCGEPSGVKRQYAAYYEDNVSINYPSLPWFDPTKYLTYVPNGFFERFQVANPTPGMPVTGTLSSWLGKDPGPYTDQVISQDAGDPAGLQPWKITLRGSSGGGNSIDDHAISATTGGDPFVPVLPSTRYTLSGWLVRNNASDNVYLDFNDGRGRSGAVEFLDAQAEATQTGVWEYVQATITTGGNTTGLRVRCVRDGDNIGNALCDGLTVTRTPPDVVEFLDVSRCDPFYPGVEAAAWYGITGGCGGGNFCPNSNITREQMAVFLVVAKWGNFYGPPACTTAPFGDVLVGSPFCRWIRAAKEQGIMLGGAAEGCAAGNFCPTGIVPRDHMAAFLIRAREGTSYLPPSCVPGQTIFSDVPASHAYCSWIEEIYRRGITGGCGGGRYCPGDPNTRGQMAVFLKEDFGFRSPLPFCP